ncbi:ABC transporter substrate-binding protein [Eubacterium oxidoreducens]|uniref:Putative ABC transport system substrate-binding protein n=1 Tax=Eubacterium oxidoreducens TaxID=1732 RepID=A0A1G6BL95_EUBOX|nr:ABC transporter substrate-binding protein [Eubacterium oxidoreducens]SDB21382.1 putative ABC transport system substrate-binding protein [Eubacterium oxidoreducens]
MKKKLLGCLLTGTLAAFALVGCGSTDSGNVSTSDSDSSSSAEYTVSIVQYVDDASLNQINASIQEELAAKGEELGVTFNIDYSNGQADATVMNQIASDCVADGVDAIIPIATPVAAIMQAATEGTDIPVIFSAVSDPVGSGLVASLDAPGANITGTSDALNTEAIMDLMFAANPNIKTVGLLYDKGQDSSTQPIKDAIAYLEAKGINYVEKTGTTNDEISLAADALVAAGCDAVFTPTDNTVMTAELAIFEKFADAGIPQYCGADSFALNGAFCGYGVNYEDLGTQTADMVVDILVNGADPASTPVQVQDSGIATINTETAQKINLDYSMFADMVTKVVETTTAEEFE